MRRFVFFAVIGTSVAWAMASAIGGCSSEDPVAAKDGGKKFNTDPNDDNTSSSSSTSSSTSSSSSSSGGEDGGGKDAASNPLASNPNKVTCGAAECVTNGAPPELCCWADSKAENAKCEKEFCPAAQGLEFKCDEKADCPAAQFCCIDGASGSSCAVDGCFDGPQLCKSDADCTTAGEKCNPVACKRAGITINIRACTNGLAVPNGCDG